jgi:hypothetical protein
MWCILSYSSSSSEEFTNNQDKQRKYLKINWHTII